MLRAISVYLPYWPTDRLRKQLGNTLPADKPIVLLGRDARRRVVMAADRKAKSLRIFIGMPATQAQALVADLHVADIDVSADDAALEKLAQWALKHYSPLVAVDSPDGLLINASGAAHLHGGELPMLQDIIRRLRASGYAARAAMAPTYAAANAFARCNAESVTVIDSQNLRQAIDRLPVAALRLSETTIDSLRKLGFDTIGDVRAQPTAPFRKRFGPELGRRLDEAYGQAAEFLDFLLPPDPVFVRRVFGEPIAAAETIARYTGKLTESLCLQLKSRHLGARCLDMHYHRVDNSVQAVRVSLAKATRDEKHLTKLLCGKIESIDPGFGIEVMQLSSSWLEPFDMKQGELNAGTASALEMASLVDKLSNRLGAVKIYHVKPVETYVPERSVTKAAPFANNMQTQWPTRWPRPIILLPKPELIDTIAMLPDYPPVSFTWRGKRRRILNADGPERIFGEWWKRDAEFEAVRDYFRLEDETGSRFWVFRAGDGVMPDSGSQRWFMHGLFA